MQLGDKVDTVLAEVPLEVQKLYADVAPEGEVPKRWIELAGDQGTRIGAIAAGVVERVETGFGVEVAVRGDDGRLYAYGHLEVPMVHLWQRVTPGQTLAHIALDPGQNAHVRVGVVDAEGVGPVDPLPFVLEPTEEPVPEVPFEPQEVENPPQPPFEPTPASLGLDQKAEELRAAGFSVTAPHTVSEPE